MLILTNLIDEFIANNTAPVFLVYVSKNDILIVPNNSRSWHNPDNYYVLPCPTEIPNMFKEVTKVAMLGHISRYR